MKAKKNIGIKIVCNNRKAKFNYFFQELMEAGIVLKGSEVKSLRDGKANIADAYASDNNGEMYLINSYIPLYKESSYNNHNPRDMRKLLLNKREINKLMGKINQEGLTIFRQKCILKKERQKYKLLLQKVKNFMIKGMRRKKETGTEKELDC